MNRVLGLALLLGLMAVAVWLGLKAASPVPTMPVETRTVAGSSAANGPPLRAVTSATADGGPLPVTPLTEPQGQALPPVPPVELPEMSGPARIEAWMASSTDSTTIANNILAGFSSLKEEDQVLAASKLVALVSDDRFDGLKRLLFDPKTTKEAKAFLFRDALSRAETLKLPLLLTIMQTPEHPCADEARETLKTQLGVDYGVNYGQWQAKISEVLRAQQ